MSYRTYRVEDDIAFVRIRLTQVWSTFKNGHSRYVLLRKGMEIPTYHGEKAWKTANGTYSAELQYSDMYPGNRVRVDGIPADHVEEF